MSREKAEASRQRIIRATTEIIEDTQQLLRDATYWNDHVRAVKWPNDPPLNFETCHVTIAKASEIRQLAIDRKPIREGLLDELIAAAEVPLG